MPTYNYYCPKCDHRATEFHGMSAKPKIKCSECKTDMKKYIGSVVPVHFKGHWPNSKKNLDDSMMKSEHPEVHQAHKEGKI